MPDLTTLCTTITEKLDSEYYVSMFNKNQELKQILRQR